MHLNIPPHDIEKLTRNASAAGFTSVETYVTHFVHALAEQPNLERNFASLTDEELAASLAMIDRARAEIEAGHFLTVHDGRRQAHENLAAGQG